jgi:hypothetical protein
MFVVVKIKTPTPDQTIELAGTIRQQLARIWAPWLPSEGRLHDAARRLGGLIAPVVHAKTELDFDRVFATFSGDAPSSRGCPCGVPVTRVPC